MSIEFSPLLSTSALPPSDSPSHNIVNIQIAESQTPVPVGNALAVHAAIQRMNDNDNIGEQNEPGSLQEIVGCCIPQITGFSVALLNGNQEFHRVVVENHWDPYAANANLGGYFATFLGLSIINEALAFANYKVLTEHFSSPTALKIAAAANLAFGVGCFAYGATLPAAMTILKPTLIVTGTYICATGGYLAVKSLGGIRNTCSRISSCFRRVFR